MVAIPVAAQASSDVFGPLPGAAARKPVNGQPASVADPKDDDDDGELDNDQDDNLFEATQTGPATQPQSLPNGTPQGEGIDHWGRLIPLNQPQSEPLLLYYTKSVYRIGRNSVCDFVFDKEARVSNSHAAFHLSETDPSGPLVLIEDLKSSNGTYINGQKLDPNRKRVLKHGDDISLGQKPSTIKTGAGGSSGHNAGVRLMFTSVTKRMMERCEVFEKYHIGEKIGSGTFAEVKRGMNLDTGELVAIKEIQKHKFATNKKTMQLFEREIDILGALSHPAICDFIECFEDDSIIYLVLEYVDGGNLLDFIMSIPGEGGMDEALAVDITRQICIGMAYCHRQGVTHRDLKPENVLLTRDDPPQAKIADFGLAKMIEKSDATMLKSMVGTPQYLAPEVVLHEKGVGYGQAVDSWSVGIIVYAMLTKLLPFSEDKDDPIEVKLNKRAKERVDYSPFDDLGVSGMATDFVDRLLTIDPKTRMSLEAALVHPWLRLPSIASPSVLGDGALPTVTSLSRTEPTTAKTERSSGDVGVACDESVEAVGEDEYSQPFAQLKIDPTLKQSAAAVKDMGGHALPPIGDASLRTGSARPSAPFSRFSSSAADSGVPMDADDQGAQDGNSLVGSASVAVEMDSSAPDGKAPAVVHPPIATRATRPAAPIPAAPPPGRKRKHSASPSAARAPLDVFGGSSSLSSIGQSSPPRVSGRPPRSVTSGPVAPNSRLATPPTRQSPRVRQQREGANHPQSDVSTSAAPPSSLRRSTRRRTTSPSRFRSGAEPDVEDEPSPAKRPATGTSKPAARSTRRKS